MRPRRALLWVIAGLIVGVFLVPSIPVHAASVSFDLTVTVAELGAGAPNFMWTISGCSASPSSGMTSAVATLVTLTASCAFTIDTPAANATLRDRLTALYATSIPEMSCASGTCTAIVLAAHVQEFLSISPNCNTPVVSAVSPTADRWYNFGTMLTVTCNGIWGRASGTGTRATSWNWNGAANTPVATTSTFVSSSIAMSTHRTYNVNIATQYQLTLDAGATRALATLTSPAITSDKYWYDSGTSVNYKGYGVFARANGFGNRSSSWNLDSGTATTLSTIANFTVPVTMTSAHTVHVSTKTQWQVTFNGVAASFLNTITPPTILNDNYWYDSGTSVTVALNGIGTRVSGSGARLVSYAINGGTSTSVATTGAITVFGPTMISAKESIVAVATTQYQLTLDSGATGALSSVTPPPIQGDKGWYDSGTAVTYSGNGVFGRAAGSGSRVASWWIDSGASTSVLTTGTFPVMVTMSAPHTIHISTKAQFQIILTGTFGVASATAPTVPGDNYWYDSGTSVSLSLQGVFGRASGAGWRMVSYAVNAGAGVSTHQSGIVSVLTAVVMTSPQNVAVNSVAQYQVTFDQTISAALISATSPTLTGDNYWYDSGSAVVVTAHGVWARNSTSGFRLVSYAVGGGAEIPVATSGAVAVLNLVAISGPQSITGMATTQYLLSVNGGGGPMFSAASPIAGDTGWYDSGTTVTVSTNATYNVQGDVRQKIISWSVDGGQVNQAANAGVVTTSAIVMNAPHVVTFSSVTQYRVTVVVRDASGSNVLVPNAVLLNVNGGTERAISGSVWANSETTASVRSITWHGQDIAPTQPAVYNITGPLTITVDARVYDVTIVVRDLLGYPVSGATATITLANGTMVHATSGGDGSIVLHMIPLGTYSGTVSNLGVSSSISGDASTQNNLGVQLALSYLVIAVFVILIVAILVGVFIIRRRV